MNFIKEFTKIYIKGDDYNSIINIYNIFKKPNPSKGVIEINYNSCACGSKMIFNSSNSNYQLMKNYYPYLI